MVVGRAAVLYAMPNPHTLRVFTLAEALNEQTHALLPALPRRGAPGLSKQISRCISSIPANIAEGAAKASQADYARMLRIALGSANEATTHLRLASTLNGAPTLEFQHARAQVTLIASMLTKLIASIERDLARKEDEKRNRAIRAKRHQRSATASDTTQRPAPIADHHNR